MKRRVIKQGHNTLTITLPSKWANANSIQAGDEIELQEENRCLCVIPDHPTEKQISKITIDITGLSTPLLWRYISSAYRDGYDEIHVKWNETYRGYRDLYTAFSYNTLDTLLNQESFELTQIEAIQALCNRFVGAELIDQKMNSCVIKELVEPSNKEFQNSLRRMFLLLLSMAEEIEESIKGKSIHKERLRGVHMIDTNLDRFEDFCIRVLNKHGYEDPKKKSTMHTLIFMLELVGDEYKRFSIHLLKTGHIPNGIREYIKEINIQVRNFYELFYSFDKKKTIAIYKQDENLEKLSMPISSDEKDPIAKELLHHLKKIGRFVISLTELRIDLEF